jgi:regulatory protein
MSTPRSPLSLKGRALRYLSMREHSRVELRQKLQTHAPDPEGLDQLLDELQAAGWLSDARFVASVVHRKAARFGAARLQSELSRHQLPKDLLQTAVSELRETEFDRALALWRKRYGQAALTPTELARQSRFLAGRGFSGDTIRQVLRRAGTDSPLDPDNND